MPLHKFTTISQLRKLTIVALVVLVVFTLAASYMLPVAQAQRDGPFLERVVNHIVYTVTFIRGYVESVITGAPQPPPSLVEDVEATPQEVRRLPPLAPPTLEATTILDAVIERVDLARGTFVVNTNLRVTGGADVARDLAVAGGVGVTGDARIGGRIEVTGDAEIGGNVGIGGGADIRGPLRAVNAFVAGGTDTSTLTVRDAAETRGLLRALGGIRTGGADIDLEGGRILGLEYVRSIEAGANVVITGEDGNLVISVPNIGFFGGGGGGGVTVLDGVLSLNGLVGGLSLVGTPNQITVTPSGSSLTLSLPQNIGITSSPVFAGLTIHGLLTVGGDVNVTGVVTARSFVSAANDATVRKSGEQIFRLSTSIFPHALPADTGSTGFIQISKHFANAAENPLSAHPTPIAGTTREYRLVIKYADSVPTASTTFWRVFQPSTSTAISAFTLPGLARASLVEPETVVTGPVTIPAGDWRLEVRVPSGRIRVQDIHIAAFDVVN